jgi:predicted NBD/HSP70 family sugar kinase
MSAATATPPSDVCAIGVDVGGTKIAAGIVIFPKGVVPARRLIPTLPERGGEAVLADVERMVSELAVEAQAASLRVSGIGVGLCEIVDRAGEVRSANCVAWQNLPVRQRLSRLAPTVMEADVRAAARAEALFGAGRNVSVFLHVSIGTGISSCLVIDGLPFIGARGATGTMASGPLPGCNETRTGALPPTLEQIASGPALVARFNQVEGDAQSGQDVLAAAEAGNARATRIVQSAAETLGGSIGWLINVLDPELVILGGGLGLREGLYRDALINSARRHIWWEGHRDLPMVSAATGIDAGVIGAAATAWKQF